VENIDDENRRKYEADYQDNTSQTKVMPIFIGTEI
jgi:hypothetical protein